ncbi:MAG: aminopeptidase [Oscillospiraceae bacterium]|nr:aminopeptidase [Oscillospiraceae bacterium]
MEDPRIRKFAKFLINSAVELQKGEKILIELHGSETGLMKALVEEAYAVGGKPFIHIFDYTVEGALVQGADDEHMAEISAYELDRMKDMDAYIDIRATTNINMWHNVSDEAQGRYRKHYWGPIHLDQRCNHTKWSVLRYPNDAMAQLAGVSTEEYEDFYFRACLVDYDKMGRAMKPLEELMNRTDKVHIVGPGTDITFSIKGIGSFGMHGNRNIPDGEIYTAPVKDSINGYITYNCPSPYNGYLFRDVYLEFKDGKIVDCRSNNTPMMNEIFDVDEGARYTGEFAIGVNPVITQPIGDILFDEKIAGSFHLTPGNSYDNTTNGNHSAVHWDLIQIQTPEFGGGEIYFDDVLIRKDGLFVLDELKPLNPENLLSEED